MTRLAVLRPSATPLPPPDYSPPDLLEPYLQSIQILDRLHRLMLDLIKDEFERLRRDDLTPVQALLLFNLGGAEVSAGELRSRGMYQGSNVSYNLKKLVQMGYVTHQRCENDRRSVRVRLSPRGEEVREIVGQMFLRHVMGLEASGILDDPPLPQVNLQWRRVERFWAEQIRYIY
ncbi:MarR family winged helix-turn-helix transcriptional regulator [Paracoccus sp. MC1862]|uniref:MarR family winged helix-turn-helix transcriptional regulator n=1 Tax=Paracoccus sp. MC1862 TaxID=2760307 RepID=UPI00160477A0|nr:MarR family transcriptional regulator [Paracoccus sp. MC1862]QQO43849.1 MarR family transcriptional regulator [Paracoccus sp. MC1862]